jgi:hypothetical protein
MFMGSSFEFLSVEVLIVIASAAKQSMATKPLKDGLLRRLRSSQ